MMRQPAAPVSAGVVGLSFARRRRFRRGDFLVEAGCPAEVVYLVRSGHVRVFLLDEDGRETTTAILGPRQPVGLAPLLGHAVHHAFAQALTDVEAWAVAAGPLCERLATDPVLLGLVVGSLSQRVGVALGLLRDVALLPVAERASDIEARLTACRSGSPPALNRTTLAGLIQARPETLARTQVRAHRPAAPPAGPTLEQTVIESGTQTFRPGEVLLQADLPAGQVGLVLTGQVQLMLAGTGGRAIVVDTLEAGDLFSIAALLGLPPVGLQLVALSDSAIEVLRNRELLHRLADQPDALRHLLHRLGIRLERLERRLARAAAADARLRVLDLLRELAAPDGQTPPDGARALPGAWSHAALARQLGVCRETVTRALAALASAGAIRRQGRHIVVLTDNARANESADARTPREASRSPVQHAPPPARGRAQQQWEPKSGAATSYRARGDHVDVQQAVRSTVGQVRRPEQPREATRTGLRQPVPGGARELPDLAHPPESRLTRPMDGAKAAHREIRSAEASRPRPHRLDEGRASRTTAASHKLRQSRARARCRLCGLGTGTTSPVCAGCADRLELELQLDAHQACPACGRHRELCRMLPCGTGEEREGNRPERARVTWLPVAQIDEPPAGQNSRRFYPEDSLAQLAASIREHGLLQPLCVRPNGSRYQLVFGVRRLRAAIRAGLQEVPCTVRVADDDRAFLLNALENLHRQQLSGTERVRAIERLAATGLGVREISRRTGFNSSTISRWLRIDHRPELKSALEAGTLDISRAKILVEAPRAALTELIEQAPSLSMADLRARVAALKSVSGPSRARVDNAHWLREALRCLRAARRADDPDLLADIRSEVKRLAGTAGDAPAAA